MDDDQTPQDASAAPQGTEDPFSAESTTQDRQDALSTTAGADTVSGDGSGEAVDPIPDAAAVPAGRTYGDALGSPEVASYDPATDTYGGTSDKEDPGEDEPEGSTQAATVRCPDCHQDVTVSDDGHCSVCASVIA